MQMMNLGHARHRLQLGNERRRFDVAGRSLH
jgi:hypothetical protein